MVILETLAHLRLRRFQYDEAADLFEKSLAAGEAIGPVPETALILNNLGTLHVQRNAFHRGIECYERAARLSARFGDDQSLSIVCSNLAVLHSRTGDPEAADAAVRRAKERDARCNSTRTRFLWLHSAGIVDMSFGRYGSAVESFKSAIVLGEELKDLHMASFDLVYLGECHLFRGEAAAARAALDRALTLASSPPAPVPSMVAARKALLSALRGDARTARPLLEEALHCCKPFSAAPGSEGPAGIPYVEAWNAVFVGWACRLLGRLEEARARLEEARAFFAKARVPSGEILAGMEFAAAESAAGRAEAAERRLKKLSARFAAGEGPLVSPMLAARLIAYRARLLLDRDPPALEDASSLILEAESHLIGRRLLELEAVTTELRERIRTTGAAGIACKASAAGGLQGPGRSPDGAAEPGGAAAGLEALGGLRRGVADLLRTLREDLGPEIGQDRVQHICRKLEDFEASLADSLRAVEKRGPSEAASVRASAILGISPAIRKLVGLVHQAAPTSLPVLITGETGSGKEIVARAIHGESPRRERPMVSVNCAALPAELLEAQLFGTLRGAFSGTEEDRPGLLVAASDGTFLFDEIGELPSNLQAKLLRVLDKGRVRPLGASEEVEVNVRYLFATNRDLGAMVKEGEFRQDLFYRLSAFEIAVPPLRERIEDLPLLAEHFRRASGRDPPRLDEGALRALAAHPWPGNVRELQNIVARLCLTSAGQVTAEQVRLLLGKPPAHRLFSTAILRSRPLADLMSELEREHLVQLHADRAGNMEEMAAVLGISVRALYDRFRRLGLHPKDLH